MKSSFGWIRYQTHSNKWDTSEDGIRPAMAWRTVTFFGHILIISVINQNLLKIYWNFIASIFEVSILELNIRAGTVSRNYFSPCPFLTLFFSPKILIDTPKDTHPYWWIYSERGPDKKVQIGEKCQVCNEQATGFNYGALTCNPCKSFFRRTILENNLTQVKLSKKPCYTCYVTNTTSINT